MCEDELPLCELLLRVMLKEEVCSVHPTLQDSMACMADMEGENSIVLLPSN